MGSESSAPLCAPAAVSKARSTQLRLFGADEHRKVGFLRVTPLGRLSPLPRVSWVQGWGISGKNTRVAARWSRLGPRTLVKNRIRI